MIALLLASASAFELMDDNWNWQREPIQQPIYVQVSSFTTSEFTSDSMLLGAFEDGLEPWNGVGNLRLIAGGDTPLDFDDSPGEFVVGFDPGEAPGSVVATASSHGFGGVAFDCEIAYFDRNAWGELTWRFTEGSGLDFAEVTTHEIGHCLGFDHSADWSAVMRPSTRGYRGLSDDDRAAVQAAYPNCVDGDGDGSTDCGGDCDDEDLTIHPGAAEICDGVDNDCDGSIDETAASTLTFGGTTFLSADRQGMSWLSMFEVQRDTTLVGFSQSVELAEPTRATWAVVDVTTGELTAASEQVDPIIGFLESPTLNVPLRAGHTYGIGLGVAGPARFHYATAASAQDGLVPVGNHWSFQVPADVDTIHGSHTPFQRLVVGTTDLDGDGVTAQCGDCDDRAAGVHPGAVDTCDGLDNDCDGSDEGCTGTTPTTPTNPPPASGGGCGSNVMSIVLESFMPPGLLRRR